MFASFKPALLDAIVSPRWWRQQSWMITTEVLMGFLAAWGLVQHMPPATLALGLGLVYATSSLGMRLVRRHGYRSGIFMLVIGILAALAAMLLPGAHAWYGLCAAIGSLLFFRDQQTVDMLAWMPVRARRRGFDNNTALRATTLLSGMLLASCFFAAGFAVRTWPWLPHAMVLAALVLLVPRQLRAMGPPRPATHIHASKHWKPSHAPTLSWLLRLALTFNSVSFLGRRLLLPAGLLMIASSMGRADAALPILGSALALMGLIGVVVRPPARFSARLGPYGLLRWGARLTLAGWGLLAAGAMAWALWQTLAALPIMLGGWVLLELTNKTWAVAYVDCLRLSATGTRALATRAHRHALTRFMSRKSTGAALGLGSASLMPATMIPALVFALVVVAFLALEGSSIPEDPAR